MMNPARYVKTPVIIEAIRWDRDVTMRELKQFTNDLVRLNDVNEEFHVYDRLHDTWVKFEYGDYIIKGVKGEFYPCAKDVFEETYRQEVEKDAPSEEQVEEQVEPEGPRPRRRHGGEISIHYTGSAFDPYRAAAENALIMEHMNRGRR